VPLVTLMGVLAAVARTVPLAQGRLPRSQTRARQWRQAWASARLLVLHEFPHVAGFRLAVQRGLLIVVFGSGSGRYPRFALMVDGRPSPPCVDPTSTSYS
jgi:hypothetical protein